MSFIVQFDKPKVDALNLLPSSHMSWSGNENTELESRVRRDGASFSVVDGSGQVLVSGLFYGDSRWRDWPLHSVRTVAEGKVDAVELVFDDGSMYRWSDDLQEIVPA